MEESYLYGWNKPTKIGASGPLVTLMLQRVVLRYGLEAAEKARIYAPVDKGMFQKSINAQLDRMNKLICWIGSSLPYAAKLEFLWQLGLPHSKNRNSNASPHCLARGINDITNKFRTACENVEKQTWEKI